MKEIKITPPDGYEIDKDNSTFEKIVFKEIKKGLPKKWEDLEKLEGYYVSASYSRVISDDEYRLHPDNKCVFLTKEQAQASIALAQLTQLREVYRQGWKPNWNNMSQEKYQVINQRGILKVFRSDINGFISFQSRKVAEEFLDNFRDLIEKASPLLFD